MIDNQEKETLHLHLGKHKKHIEGHVKSVEFINDGRYVIYFPSLGVSSYGEDKEEAIKMMKVVIDDYCQNLMELTKEQILQHFKKLGWHKHVFFTELSKSAHVDREGILRDFELAEDTQLTENFVTV